MNYFQTEKDKLDRAERLSNLIIKMKNNLDDPLDRTKHKIYRSRKFRKSAEKELSALGFSLDLETEILRRTASVPPKNLLREDMARKQDDYIRAKIRYKDILKEVQDTKQLYNDAKNIYFESRITNETN